MSLAVLVTLYGALLRLDAYCGKYGRLDHPGWASFATHELAATASHLRPSAVHWARESNPYVGGDPANYLRFAREMTTFYQPHVREPVFLALTRGALYLLDQQDAAVSLASAIGSTAAIFGTFLLVSELVSPLAGLFAALLMAVEYDLIIWSVDGWRDDVFMATVVFAAWALLRFRRQASLSNALLVGFTAGISCLTRITALSFVVPGLAWIAIAGDVSSRRTRATYAGVAAVIAAAVVAPFMISCAIATGDPLYAIDYHTVYYRAAEGMPLGHPMSAAAYLREKLVDYPVNTLDVFVTGLFVRPFVTKWQGFGVWLPDSGLVLRWLSLAGLAAMPFFGKGRLLLLVLFASLVPFAFTWNVGDGGEWRFTMHAYPFYLAAAALAVAGVYRVVARVVAAAPAPRRTMMRRLIVDCVVVVVVAGAAAEVYRVLPWFDVREHLRKGDSVSVEAGARDGVFFRNGWSPAHLDGSVPVRLSTAQRAIVRFPLPAGPTRYQAVLRLDPADPARPETVSVLFNSQLVATLNLQWDPTRVGSYPVPLPSDWAKPGSNELALVPARAAPAGLLGARFAWIEPSQAIGLRVWQVRLIPQF